MNKIIFFLVLVLSTLLFFIEIKKNNTITYINKNIILSKQPYHFLTKAQQYFDNAVMEKKWTEKIQNLKISKSFLNSFDYKEITPAKDIIDKIIKTKKITPLDIRNFNNSINAVSIKIYRQHLNNAENLEALKSILNKNAVFIEYIILLINLLLIIIWFLYSNYKKIKDIYHLDPLTFAYNRNKFYEETTSLPKGKHSIIMLDIDHFKKINDTYGHDVGDIILQKTVEIIKENIRNNDMIFRWGGEEFIILLQNTSKENALKVAHKIKKAISNYDFEGIKITSSFGIKECTNSITKEDLILVDKALYEAKKKRNEIVCC
jgi:diguanylate cyclase (GGDEF)-like protein